MRLFVAIAIADDVRENLASFLDRLRHIDAGPRWVNAGNLHVTLKFIGETPAEKISAIGGALAAVRIDRRLSLEFRGVGFFPDARRPSVAWVGIASDDRLATLALNIDKALAQIGLPREKRAFVPHLTIARFKEMRLSSALAQEIKAQEQCGFGVVHSDEFYLIESKLKPSGAEYIPLRSFAFVEQPPKGHG